MLPAWLGPAIADGVERRPERYSAAILTREREVAREGAGEDARRDHGGGEARTLLVGPVDDLDRREGLVARLHQCAQRFQRSKHAEHAVELAAGRLGIEMTPHRDRRNVGALARPSREHRTHVVNSDGAAKRLAAGAKPVAYLLVEIGQRETADTALGRAAD